MYITLEGLPFLVHFSYTQSYSIFKLMNYLFYKPAYNKVEPKINTAIAGSACTSEPIYIKGSFGLPKSIVLFHKLLQESLINSFQNYRFTELLKRDPSAASLQDRNTRLLEREKESWKYCMQ
jgi:hypothetical protein